MFWTNHYGDGNIINTEDLYGVSLSDYLDLDNDNQNHDNTICTQNYDSSDNL